MALKIKNPPGSEPVSLVEAKNYLRITDNDDDALISSLVTAIRQKAETWTRRSFITQTWTLWLDSIPEGAMFSIPLPLLQSVTHIKSYDSVNTVSTLDPDKYFVDGASIPGRIALNDAWPTGLRRINSIEIEFVAGFGDASSVPETIKQGILQWIKLLFANKSKLYESDESTSGLLELNRVPIPPTVMVLWEPYRVFKI
ncbi:MAG: phage head-tail connector protein [Nitrospinae bacterium]|nr:phage head-tail connector protein [Nitrospinota bacterium]MBL7020697.1 phage head-tail connector protein [Nitrospinaceae bacterium]